MRPRLGRNNPTIIRTVVLLPEPFGPSSPTTLRAAPCSVRGRPADPPLKLFQTSSTSSTLVLELRLIRAPRRPETRGRSHDTDDTDGEDVVAKTCDEGTIEIERRQPFGSQPGEQHEHEGVVRTLDRGQHTDRREVAAQGEQIARNVEPECAGQGSQHRVAMTPPRDAGWRFELDIRNGRREHERERIRVEHPAAGPG